MAIESGLPIVPVAVRSSRHVMLKGRLMTCPGEVSLEIFDPIPTAGGARADAGKLATRVRELVAGAVSGDEDPA
jgi:1-acyl-sn-glycerol-3-phosphate acyltransferase